MSGIIGAAGSKSGVIGETELDYEEGTWTPQWKSEGGSGECTYSDSGNSVNGVYTKVGRMVVANLMTGIAGTSGVAAGNVIIEGLPYPPDNVLDDTSYEASGSCSYWTGYGSSVSCLIPLVAQQGHIKLNEIPGGGSANNSFALISDLTSNSVFRITVTYFIGGGGS